MDDPMMPTVGGHDGELPRDGVAMTLVERRLGPIEEGPPGLAARRQLPVRVVARLHAARSGPRSRATSCRRPRRHGARRGSHVCCTSRLAEGGRQDLGRLDARGRMLE